MPTLRFRFALLLLIAAASSCFAQAPPDDASAVRAVLDAQVVAWNKGDIAGYMQGYWNSPDLTFYSGATAQKGWQATLDRYKLRYTGPGKDMGHLNFTDLNIEMLGPDAAFVRGRWHLTMKDGKQPHGLFTLILKRFPDGWKIVHDHTSSA